MQSSHSISDASLPSFYANVPLMEALETEFEKNKVNKTSAYRSLGAFAQQFHPSPDNALLQNSILAYQIALPLLKALFEDTKWTANSELVEKLASFEGSFQNGFLEQWKKYCVELQPWVSDWKTPQKEQFFVAWQTKFEQQMIFPYQLAHFVQQSAVQLEQPSLYEATFWQDIQPSVGTAYTCTISIWSFLLWKTAQVESVFWANSYSFVQKPQQTLLFNTQTKAADSFYDLLDIRYQIVVGNSFFSFDEEVDFSAIDNRVWAAYTPLSDKMSFSPKYLRFLRWATDHLAETGVVATWLPREVLYANRFEGFRKRVQAEFDSVYVLDLDYSQQFEENSSSSGENTEKISSSALLFLVRKNKSQYQNGFRLAHLRSQCPVYYWRPSKKFGSLEDFSDALCRTQFQNLSFKKVSSAVSYWIALPEDDFLSFLPLTHKATQTAKKLEEETALFKWASPALLTARDEWMYDFDKENLENKASYFTSKYEEERERWKNSSQNELLQNFLSKDIKWTAELMQRLKRDAQTKFRKEQIREASYRPFVKQWVYLDDVITHRPYQQFRFFPLESEQKENPTICVTVHQQVPLVVHATKYLPDNGYGSRASYAFPKYFYDDESDSYKENITDWALEQFRHHYSSKAVKFKAKNFKELKKNLKNMRSNQKEARTITKEAVFAYIYALLHSPSYRQKYKKILHSQLPRIPMHEDFWKWVSWGEELLDLHLNYEDAIIYPLEREDTDSTTQKPILKADRVRGIIWIDQRTYLKNIPEEAWQYRLGVRSAMEWVLEQYKERKLRDKTVRVAQENGLFAPYRFHHYKEHLIELVRKVCRVSIETTKIVNQMP